MKYTAGRSIIVQTHEDDKQILIVVNDGEIRYYTMYKDFGSVDLAFGVKDEGQTDEALVEWAENLYEQDYFRWAWYYSSGERAEEVLYAEYLNSDEVGKIKFDLWVANHYDLDDFR